MAEEEDDRPRRQTQKTYDLAKLSVGELKDYIASLEAEIERARAAIAARQSTLGAAEALFKKR